MEIIRELNAEKLLGQKLVDFVMSNGDPGQEKILKHWENHFKGIGSPYFVRKEGLTSTLWKKDNTLSLKQLNKKGDYYEKK